MSTFTRNYSNERLSFSISKFFFIRLLIQVRKIQQKESLVVKMILKGGQ